MAAKNKTAQHQDPELVIENSLNRFELFLERNGKTLLIALGAIVVLVGIYFGYRYLYSQPRMKQASAAMFEAQYQFERDSFALALNGNATFDGFLTIADRFGGTPQGNLARHYAGICHLRLGEFQQAIDAFDSYKAVKNPAGEIIAARNYGLAGDAYVEMGNLQQGVKMYEKAVAYSDNLDTAPVYLKKAGLVNESLGNLPKALEQYQTIRNHYSQSMQARDIEKFIARVQQSL